MAGMRWDLGVESSLRLVDVMPISVPWIGRFVELTSAGAMGLLRISPRDLGDIQVVGDTGDIGAQVAINERLQGNDRSYYLDHLLV